MPRETKVIETPLEKDKVELKVWITGREKRELRNIFLENVKFNENKPESIGNSADIINQAENKAIETVVVSVNEDSKDILNKILEMKAKDYDFVIREINKITKEEDFLE